MKDSIVVAMEMALKCNHGRWIGESQFAVCIDCLAVVLETKSWDCPRCGAPCLSCIRNDEIDNDIR